MLEKETKTKAYSKEGLLKINQKRRAIDEPGSAAYEMMEWLRAYVSVLRLSCRVVYARIWRFACRVADTCECAAFAQDVG